MDDVPDSSTPPPSSSVVSYTRSLPIREDCWTEEATMTLVEAWGRRYVELNRGNLRQKDWQEVADAVNALHAHSKKTHRTDVQCKNRIDTIKKKYKLEKARICSSSVPVMSTWVFYDRMDTLIGSMPSAKKISPPAVAASLFSCKQDASGANKRDLDEGYFKRNYSTMAAAAAAAAAETESEDEEIDERGDDGDEEKDGAVRLARAIERFGEVYERVEYEKLRQIVDLEKQRMKFSKDLEMERMRIFSDTQIQLEMIKRGRKSGKNG